MASFSSGIYLPCWHQAVGETLTQLCKDQVTAEKDVVPNENQDATLDEKTTKSTDEELTEPKLLNNLSRDEFFRILENVSLDLSKPP